MNSGRNWLGVMFGACFIWLTDLDSKKIEAEVFGKILNVVQEENGEDKMAREITNEVLERVESRGLF